ncbi:HDOD domain-containing protein [bacterium]|nr:HDOD domain-containing protein [bacterium]
MKRGFYLDKRMPDDKMNPPCTAKKNIPCPAVHVHSKERLAEQMLVQVEKLPPLPAVATQIMRLIKDDKSDAKSFEGLLKQDPLLTARLLRLVNSSFFGLPNKIASIPQAIVVIGFKSLKNLVIAASVNRMMEGQFPGYGFTEGGLWRHSILNAQWSEKLAKELGWTADSTEEIFVIGLLHDVGKLILSSYINEHMQDMISTLIECRGDIIEAENRLVGITHPEVGSYIAKEWKFPDQLSAIIRDHHKFVPEKYEKESAVLQVVNYLINKNHIGMYDHFPLEKPLCEQCLEVLGLNQTDLPEIQQGILASSLSSDEQL